MSSNNIIQFPDLTKREELDIIYEASDFRVEDIEEKLKYLMPYIFGYLAEDGYDISYEDNIEDVLLIHDSIRSAIYKTLEMYHPLQDFSEEAYSEMIVSSAQAPLDLSLIMQSAKNDNGD